MADHDNLENFAASGCEDAFRKLVERYANLVFSAALRRTLGNRELAQEVAQNVFAIMARKARRRGWIEPQGLAPWLHRTAVLESANARRKEQRRSKALERLATETMTTFDQNQFSQPAIDELDAAIDSLPDADRSLLMMHYYDGMSYREVADVIGKSEAASRKQASRALAKLENRLGKKGIALGTAGTASLLSVKLLEAAPVGFGKVIATSALASAGSVSTLTIIQNTLNTMAYAKTKTAVAVALIAAIPLISQLRDNRELHDRLATLEAGPFEKSPMGKNTISVKGGSPRPVKLKSSIGKGALAARATSGTDGSVFSRWQAALIEPDPVKRNQALAELIASLTPEGAKQAMEAFVDARETGGDFSEEMRLFMRAWGGIDGESAVAEALRGRHSSDNEQVMLAQSVLGGWASKDAPAALAWIESQGSDPRLEHFVIGLIDGWSVHDFESAAAYAETRPSSSQRDYFVQLLLQRAMLSGGVPAAQSWFAGISDDEHNAGYRKDAFDGVVQTMLYRDPSEAAAWIAANSASAGLVDSGTLKMAVDSLALKSPEDALDWVESLGEVEAKAKREGTARAFHRWMNQNVNEAGEWLGKNSDHPDYDWLAGQFASKVRTDDIDAAREWAGTIKDETSRAEHLAMLDRQQEERISPSYLTVDFLNGIPATTELFRSEGGTDEERSLFSMAQSQQRLSTVEFGTEVADGIGIVNFFEDAEEGSNPKPMLHEIQLGSGSDKSKHPPITGASSCTQCHAR